MKRVAWLAVLCLWGGAIAYGAAVARAQTVTEYCIYFDSDDAGQRASGQSFDWEAQTPTEFMRLGADPPNSPFNAGFRFRDIDLAKNATPHAELVLINDFGQSTKGTWYGEADPESRDFADRKTVNNRTRTVAAVPWNPVDLLPDQELRVDVSAIAAEILAKSTWNAGDHITLIFVADPAWSQNIDVVHRTAVLELS